MAVTTNGAPGEGLLRLPAAFEVMMPAELTNLVWLDVNQQVDVETMWRDRETNRSYVAIDPEGDVVAYATRQRFAISGTALGPHPEVGTVTYESEQRVTTAVRVVLAYTPWVLA